MVNEQPVILITGASGDIGKALVNHLKDGYRVFGLDLKPCPAATKSFECDLTTQESVNEALASVKEECGNNIKAVIHLAAYFDFTGEDSPLYRKVNVEGTCHLLKALQDFEVGRFIYSSTMLVHKAGRPGEKIDEDTPLAPGWAYPRSKAETEQVIKDEHGNIPYSIVRLAGLYDDRTAVPTLAYQIARIYEREFKSHLYAGDLDAGQAFIHRDDMLDVFAHIVEQSGKLPRENILLAGEDEVMGYRALQNRIGCLIYGEEEWQTFEIPELVAKPAAWLEEKAEPVIPDAFDHGEKPFIKPFMIDLASDHYDLDISRARKMLGWKPRHNICEGLSPLIANLKAHPARWYKENKITMPDWIKTATDKKEDPEKLHSEYENQFRREHRAFLWAHFLNIGLGLWLITAPFILGYQTQAMTISDMISGIALVIFAGLALSWRLAPVRYACGLVSLWVLGAPLVFWTPSAAAYLNGTLVGMLILGLSLLTRPAPGISPVAALTGPTSPPGWNFTPSSWFQRMPVIILAFIGFFISRYLCAYQLGHIGGIWDPFFSGAIPEDAKNGTEEIITSSVSEAWPVPDAGLGALTYALEILTGIMGSSRRWRTMPWLVMLFGIMIVPLGIVSIFFIIIQPVMLGTWCTLCLIAAAAMLIQIPYSLDELVATSEFLWRRKKQGRPLLRIFFTGDTDEGDRQNMEDDFEQAPGAIIQEMISGGITLPKGLVGCIIIGVWLMFTRLTLGNEGTMADADHIIGSLVITIAVTALAETARIVRFLIIPFGAALLVTPFLFHPGTMSLFASTFCGLALMVLSLPRGPVHNSYGGWNKFIK